MRVVRRQYGKTIGQVARAIDTGPAFVSTLERGTAHVAVAQRYFKRFIDAVVLGFGDE
jgi:hypothetical protein